MKIIIDNQYFSDIIAHSTWERFQLPNGNNECMRELNRALDFQNVCTYTQQVLMCFVQNYSFTIYAQTTNNNQPWAVMLINFSLIIPKKTMKQVQSPDESNCYQSANKPLQFIAISNEFCLNSQLWFVRMTDKFQSMPSNEWSAFTNLWSYFYYLSPSVAYCDMHSIDNKQCLYFTRSGTMGNIFSSFFFFHFIFVKYYGFRVCCCSIMRVSQISIASVELHTRQWGSNMSLTCFRP